MLECVTVTYVVQGVRPAVPFLLLIVLQLLCDLPHLLLADIIPDPVHGGIAAKLPEVTARVSFGLLSNLFQIYGITQLCKTTRTIALLKMTHNFSLSRH